MFTLDFNAIAAQLTKTGNAIVDNALAPAIVDELLTLHGLQAYGGAIIEEGGKALRVLYL